LVLLLLAAAAATGFTRHFAVNLNPTALADKATLNEHGNPHYQITYDSAPGAQVCLRGRARSLYPRDVGHTDVVSDAEAEQP